ncbi:EAL domain-containing protein [Acidithiobacillus sp.]|uniref:putative bifunctional diguanylate cyclase/phosphodiesterase n=1 Tax=Acidithiobacillus sp. TaxID=1872118 RepID=UPI0025C31CC4|nr:EAL domain-containing protein [Acidithiobacillus sp.]MCK9187640.1 EAL domain-containing protein [Acidithiobacillus sp.]MCK9358530.1 EAL domain-containing protein [Acidithiobacillus sp.]
MSSKMTIPDTPPVDLTQQKMAAMILAGRLAQRRQPLYMLGIALIFMIVAGLTYSNSQGWQHRLIQRAAFSEQQAGQKLADSVAINLATMLQMHLRDLRLLAGLPEKELTTDLVTHFDKVHTWLAKVSCNAEKPRAQNPSDKRPLKRRDDAASGMVSAYHGSIGVPGISADGVLHIPMSVTAHHPESFHGSGNAICSADLLFGKQQVMVSPKTDHIVLLLDNLHRVLAVWRQGHWSLPDSSFSRGLPAHIDIPVAGTPWMISARWNPALASGLQSQLERIGTWTVLLMVAEAILAMITLIWRYRRFMDARYQRMHQALQALMLESPGAQDFYEKLVQISVLATGALAASVAVPDHASGQLPVHAAHAQDPRLQEVLGSLPLSLDPDGFPWGQMSPCLAYHRKQPVNPCSSQFSRVMTQVIQQCPEWHHYREMIAWPILLSGEKNPCAIFMLKVTRINRWLFGKSLIAHWESLLHDVERYLERLEARSEQERLMQTDTLTGLPNRARFSEQAECLLRVAEYGPVSWGIAVLDLDLFNEINTSYGPHQADNCLRMIAHNLGGVLTEKDTLLARIGGDEFGIMIPVADGGIIADISSQLLLAVTAAARQILDAPLSTSIGWSFFPQDGQNIHTLLAQADEAMAEAKKSGGNEYRVYSGAVAQRAVQRLWVHRSFPGAIERGDVHFFLQPKADMLAVRLTGVEMLARWRSVEGRWIWPGKFMPYVEENAHLIRLLGIRVLQEAVRLRERMHDEHLPLQISINIGAKHFLNPAFTGDLETHCPDGRGITLEITETASVTGRKSAQPVMEWCQSRGFALSMDDFGTGYSSLLSVARLRFNELKLDQGFIRAFRKDLASFGVAGASRLLSQIAQCDLVAEGVATPDELHLWLLLGGRYIQGYLLAPPLPENAFFTWQNWLLPAILRPTRAIALQDMAALWQQLQQENA